jgi:hypothetical protein
MTLNELASEDDLLFLGWLTVVFDANVKRDANYDLHKSLSCNHVLVRTTNGENSLQKSEILCFEYKGCDHSALE